MKPISSQTIGIPPDPKTLTLLKKITLTIRADNSLQIRDSTVDKSTTRSWCGVGVPEAGRSTVIPLYNILWADVGESSITIKFAAKGSGEAVKASSLTYPYEISTRQAVDEWITTLLKESYGEAQFRMRFKVLLNPFGGQKNAVRIFETSCRPILDAANCTLDVQTTQHNGHAIEIAESIDISAYEAIICCSGDGIPHEVFNGLSRRKDAIQALKKVAVCQLPGGSGNAMSWNLCGTGEASAAALSIIKSTKKPLDLISITQGEKRFLSFLSQSFGMIADVDLGTEDLRWMGSARFTYGLIQRVWKQTVYPCDIAIKVAIGDKEEIRKHYHKNDVRGSTMDTIEMGLPELKYGTVNSPLPDGWPLVHYPSMGNFYAGNMAWVSAGANFFPAALPNDGLFDLLCVDGDVGRKKSVSTLLSVETGKHFNMPHVNYRKVLGYRIVPHRRQSSVDEYISIDGERIPFEPFQAEIHSGLGTVLAKGDVYEAPGV